MSRTMTRAQLSESIYQEIGLSRNESADLLDTVLAEVSAALVNGETVKISSFGRFSVRQKAERIGRNPKTGEEVPILPRKVLVFRPSQLLKARIRGDQRSESDYSPIADEPIDSTITSTSFDPPIADEPLDSGISGDESSSTIDTERWGSTES